MYERAVVEAYHQASEQVFTTEAISVSIKKTRRFNGEMGKTEYDDVQNNYPSEDNEATSVVQHQLKQPNVSSLHIPERSIENTLPTFTRSDSSKLPIPSSTRLGLPTTSGSVKLKSSLKILLPQISRINVKNSSDDGEKTVFIMPESVPSDMPSIPRSFSLNKAIYSSSSKSVHCVPISKEMKSNNHSDNFDNEFQQHMMRSFSVPVNLKCRNLKGAESSGCLIRVISVRPRPATVDSDSLTKNVDIEAAIQSEAEDIPEEEAVCRICFVELSEGGETLKMECSCKGELALAHKECAVKWFSIKGNKTCDICKQDVRNISVTLLKVQNPEAMIPTHISRQTEVGHFRGWQDVPILVMVSVLAYFCFLEQLLVSDLGRRALQIALPFSLVLGLLSSVAACTLVSRRFKWACAAFQFAIIIAFAHIFYNVVQLSSILSVILASFTGFGIAISAYSILVGFLKWKAKIDTIQHDTGVDLQLQDNHHQEREQSDQQPISGDGLGR